MYTQFFGNYLLSNAYVTQEQLFSAMKKLDDSRIRLGTLALHYGYMTSDEVDAVIVEQTHQSRKFGEIAIENGYLTEEQVASLLKEQTPDFLLLGQILVDEGVLSNSDLEKIVLDYRTQNEMIELDMTVDNHDSIMGLIDQLLACITSTPLDQYSRMYFELLFNDFIRFVGEDFSPLPAEEVDVFPTESCICQKVNGAGYELTSMIVTDTETAIAFASRYVGDSFAEYDEYVQASLEDFLNLHNGLFIVNISNSTSQNFTIDPPYHFEDPILELKGIAYHFPILYSFGTIHFIVEIKKLEEDSSSTEEASDEISEE